MASRDDLLIQLGRLVRARRGAAGWTQRELAKRASLSAKYISEIERGTRDVPVSTLRSIAEGLGFAIDVRFSSRGGDAPTREALPRALDAVARLAANLPEDTRAEVVRIFRAVVKLAGGRATSSRSSRRSS